MFFKKRHCLKRRRREWGQVQGLVTFANSPFSPQKLIWRRIKARHWARNRLHCLKSISSTKLKFCNVTSLKIYFQIQTICHAQSRVWHLYRFWHERISEYIRVKKMTRTNIRIYLYVHFWEKWISEYIRIKILIRKNIWINIRFENIWTSNIKNIC